jgi:hypothetical protein
MRLSIVISLAAIFAAVGASTPGYTYNKRGELVSRQDVSPQSSNPLYAYLSMLS